MERNRYQTRGGRGGGGVGSNNQNVGRLSTEKELQLQLQWGSRKRLRCLKIQRNDNGTHEKPLVAVRGADRRASLPAPNRTPFSPTLPRALRQFSFVNLEAAANAGGAVASLEKGGGSSSGSENNTAWPKLAIQLTVKEKEEDFMIFKGSKPPQRPKKRAKLIQKTINMVTPGSWMSDLCVERYEVREKKTSKKKPGGLKAMGNMDSDSE
ncbi:Uncharacterized protein M6B38_229935 [Iris pallida]|uniref:Uncharacterized protein n=1 Tax=Iris pallida TaxID=29817 RepID=A0AAX6DSI7_IRIPA|nr:Uncharacterized protein M6B38_229935 [Iris pallida]